MVFLRLNGSNVISQARVEGNTSILDDSAPHNQFQHSMQKVCLLLCNYADSKVVEGRVVGGHVICLTFIQETVTVCVVGA